MIPRRGRLARPVSAGRQAYGGRPPRRPVAVRKALLKDGTQLVLRRPKEAELKAMAQVYIEAVREGIYFGVDRYQFNLAQERRWLRAYAGRRGMITAAFDAHGTCIGVVVAGRGKRKKNAHTALIDPIVVARAFRGQGAGRLLLDEAVAWARSQRIEKLCLDVFASNRAAVALYRSAGFVEDGRQRRQFKIRGRYVDGMGMALFLKR